MSLMRNNFWLKIHYHSAEGGRMIFSEFADRNIRDLANDMSAELLAEIFSYISEHSKLHNESEEDDETLIACLRVMNSKGFLSSRVLAKIKKTFGDNFFE